MTPEEQQTLASVANVCYYNMIDLLVTVFGYGMFVLGISVSIRLIVNAKAYSRVTLFTCLVTTFIAFTWYTFYIGAYNLIATKFLFVRIQPEAQGEAGVIAQLQIAGEKTFNMQYMPSWALTISVLLSDFIVVWRAWFLFQEERLSKFTLAFLMLANIGINIADCILTDLDIKKKAAGGTVVLDWLSNVISLVVNFVATSFIAWKAWNHHQLMAEAAVPKRTRVENILLLLVESGGAYCTIQVMFTIFTLINTYGSVEMPYLPVLSAISIVAAACYPVTVVILINKDSSPVIETFQIKQTTVGNREDNVSTRMVHSELRDLTTS
ncbi:hypothetical protein GYMLUDRAFT_237265 [Collybiopsis luxurians FD-317 M1]|nr:hypothetical protein GYMLUDRAFT_237265 [Collybiopsis luxurians FD-317 M1]